MADYTAFVEASNALVEMLRDKLTPEPLGDREAISLCSPHDSGNNQLTLYLYQVEEESPQNNVGYYQADRNTMRIRPAQFVMRYLVTAHSKAPAQLKEADQHRLIGAVVQTLRDNPVIPSKYVSGSSAAEGAQLHVSVEKTTMEQMLKIWNNTTKEYKLSLVVMLTGASISSGRTRQVARVEEVEISAEQSAPGGGA
ncbi:MAG: DUF4255 domain-containing protein [Oscillibacter sp.]|nr:DUF4255 domain-containing protein [Oscillibacter sp.]